MKTPSKLLTAGALAVLFGGVAPREAAALLDSGSVPAGWQVWSCWYWPYVDSVNPNLYDAGEAIQRYDRCAGSGNVQQWEYNRHGPPQNPDTWWGHCHAWAAAACWEPQPVGTYSVGGVAFRTRDLKGLCVETYFNCADGNKYELYAGRPSPGLFWRYLRQELRGDRPMHGHGMSFVGELYYGPEEVWNYPIFQYEVRCNDAPPYAGTITIYYALDGKPVQADSADLHYATRTYTFRGVRADGTHPVDSGTWDGSGPYHRPDAIWRPFYSKKWMTYCAAPMNEALLTRILTPPREQARSTPRLIEGVAFVRESTPAEDGQTASPPETAPADQARSLAPRLERVAARPRMGNVLAVAVRDWPAAERDPNAWIGFYAADQADDRSYLQYTFLKNLTDDTYDVPAPEQPGRYEFRLFRDGGYQKLATSEILVLP